MMERSTPATSIFRRTAFAQNAVRQKNVLSKRSAPKGNQSEKCPEQAQRAEGQSARKMS